MRQKDAETAMSAFDFRLPCEVEVEISASVSSSMRIHTSRAEFLETRWRNFEFRAEGGRFFTCRGKHLADTWPNAPRNVSVSRAWAAYPWDTGLFGYSDTVCVPTPSGHCCRYSSLLLSSPPAILCVKKSNVLRVCCFVPRQTMKTNKDTLGKIKLKLNKFVGK